VAGSESHLSSDVLNQRTDFGNSQAPIKLDFSPTILFLLQLVPHYFIIATKFVLHCNKSCRGLAEFLFSVYVATGLKVRHHNDPIVPRSEARLCTGCSDSRKVLPEREPRMNMIRE
jgi:hypothetical protein